MARAKSQPFAFDAIAIEGVLISPAMLASIAARAADGQTEADYAIPKGLTVRDEVARFFRIGQALFRDAFGVGEPAVAKTVSFTEELLRDVFGFTDINRVGFRTKDGRRFALTIEASGGRVPVVVVPPSEKLDQASQNLAADGRRRSAASALQEWLNADDGSLWGLACNGERLRLLRDNASLTRPAYIEANLRQVFEAEDFASFTALWLLIHASRFGATGAPPTDAALERWREAGTKEGLTARDRLRDGVEAALLVLGNGFLAHSANAELRNRIADNKLPLPEFFAQLLRLIYRLIFLMVAEDRGLLHPPGASPQARRLYDEGYSLRSLRERAIRSTAWDRYSDKWDGLVVVFKALARGEAKLGLPGLAGLFSPDQVSDLDAAQLSNRALLEAIYRLAWLKEDASLLPVNWRDMETEELGSVYESLLELTPRLIDEGRAFAFAEGAETKGNARKRTSSYYTPDSLVQLLLDRALEPVLDRVEAEAKDQAAALLGVSVIDPACGSGHFLLAAARRIATRVARARAGGVASADDYRHALRDTVRACIYGVDRNPMAVELAKVALWIETVDPGKPLGFLDANIRCGDALFGVFDFSMLTKGIPDEAYKALAGDDPDTATHFKALNRAEREGQGTFDFASGGGRLPQQAPLASATRSLRALPEETPEDVAEKRRKFDAALGDPKRYSWKVAADLFVAAFLTPKTGGVPDSRNTATIPTTAAVWQALEGKSVYGPLEARAVDLAEEAHAFHWPLEYPDIMAEGGFDVVLGNPPWDTMSPDAKEFFSQFDGTVRFLAPSEQEELVNHLLQQPGVQTQWDAYCRQLYVAAHYMRKSARYRLFAQGNLGKGDFNVYRMFVELALHATRSGGRAAQFVPENLYNGANAQAIRQHLFERTQWTTLVAFENTGKIWFDIDSRAKFCLYAAAVGGSTRSFGAAFGVNSMPKLNALKHGLPFDIPVELVKEFSPDALAITEFAHPADITIAKKLYERLPKFGAIIPGAPARSYMRELDMGSDRDEFESDPSGVPIYEGRMVDMYDYRAKEYVSGRGRQAKWRDLAFDTREKQIRPQWRIPKSALPEKIGNRWKNFRIGFCDVGGVTNARFVTAALIPGGVVCGHTVPTIVFEPDDPCLMMLWLGVANSFVLDFLARRKAALHMTFTLTDSLPLPRKFTGNKLESAIAERVLRLSATGPEMRDFLEATVRSLGMQKGRVRPVEAPAERDALRSEIDVLVARDLIGLTLDEMRYVLDPSSILGPDCEFETFGALKRAEERQYGAFRSADLILSKWLSLAVPE